MRIFIPMTGKELMRKKVFLIAVVMTVLFLGLFAYAISQIAAEQEITNLITRYAYGTMALSVGLFFAHMIVAFIVFFSTMGAISSEIESGLMYAIVPRPLGRWKIYLGKWIGFSVWSLMYSAVIFISIVWIVHWQLQFPINLGSIGRAFLLFEFIPLILVAVSLLGSIFLPTLGNGVASALLFGLSIFGGMLERIVFISSQMREAVVSGIERFGLITSLLMPTDSIYRRMTYELSGGLDLPLGREAINIMGPFANPVVPSIAFVWYSLVYLIILLGLGCRYFSRKDI